MQIYNYIVHTKSALNDIRAISMGISLKMYAMYKYWRDNNMIIATPKSHTGNIKMHWYFLKKNIYKHNEILLETHNRIITALKSHTKHKSIGH